MDFPQDNLTAEDIGDVINFEPLLEIPGPGADIEAVNLHLQANVGSSAETSLLEIPDYGMQLVSVLFSLLYPCSSQLFIFQLDRSPVS